MSQLSPNMSEEARDSFGISPSDTEIGRQPGLKNTRPENGEPQPRAGNSSFFFRLRHGEYSLAKTYWLFGVLVGMGFNILASILASDPVEKLLDMIVGEFMTGVIYLAYCIFLYFYSVNILIGIWRTANKYRGPKIWSILAKIAAFLGWCSLFLRILGFLIGFVDGFMKAL